MSEANERMEGCYPKKEPQSGDTTHTMSSHRVHFFYVIWSTKGRSKSILPKVRDQLYPYLNGIIKKCNGSILVIGGMLDHVHLLLEISNLDNYTATIRNAKAGSSGWLKGEFPEYNTFLTLHDAKYDEKYLFE
ncbi:MAG: transposase [Parachlamydiales bacterium]|jgi:REP element-mobilizing transposase RayT